jgi:hypothetical protein
LTRPSPSGMTGMPPDCLLVARDGAPGRHGATATSSCSRRSGPPVIVLLFSKDCRHSIWIVGGKPDYSKIAAEPDVIRFVHSPGMHLVTPVQ